MVAAELIIETDLKYQDYAKKEKEILKSTI